MADVVASADGLAIPAPTLLCGDIGVIVSIPPPTISSGDNGVIVSIPPPTISAIVVMDSIILTLPAPTMDATGDPGSYNEVDAEVPAPALAADALVSVLLVVQQEVPAPILIASGLVSIPVTASLIIPAPTLSATALIGADATALLEIAAPTMEAAGYSTYSISVVVSVPPPQIISYASVPVQVAFRNWVLNTRKGALTEYGPEFAFNSYATFNNVVLACGTGGVVVLGTQATDNGSAISARFRTGKSDYDRSLLKRVPRLYLDYETDGDMYFRTITSESGTRTYQLSTNNVVGFQQRRVPVGKGPKAAFWQYEGENIGGSDFAVQSILAYPLNLRRRIM